MASPRKLIKSIGNTFQTTAEYLMMKRSGFDHSEATEVFDALCKSCDAQTAFHATLAEFVGRKRKELTSEISMVDALNTLALRDGGNASVVRRGKARQGCAQRLEQWVEGMSIIVNTSSELLKEYDALKTRIEHLNKQVAELEASRRGKENAEVARLEQRYAESKASLLADCAKLMAKKDELTTRWCDKWAVLDQRLAAAEQQQ